MDNQNNPNIPQDDNWFDNLLSKPDVGEEIGPDEHAVSAAGLTSHEDLELERIIHEAKSMDEPVVHVPQEPQEGPFRDEEYRQAFGAGEDLASVFDEEAAPVIPEYEDEPVQEPTPQKEAPVRKVRPRRKKGYGLLGIPHILATVIWLAIAVAIGVSLGRMIWVCAAEVLAFGKTSQEISITIEDGDDVDIIANKLKNAGLIKYPGLFKIYANLTDAQEEIAPGTYTLNSIYDYNALVNFMTPHAATRETKEVMIPEGYTCAQIFSLLEEEGVCSVAELEAYAATGELDDYWFLSGVVRGDRYCLEGYLFPDTYEFYTNDDAGRVLGKFLRNFDYRFTDVMKEKLEPLNQQLAKTLANRGYGQDYINEHKIGIREIVIIASMIEKETSGDGESYTISSVIYNRLTNPRSYPFLNIDATIIYALGGNIDPATGKTKPLTKEDLQLDSPYNSYNWQGLIPGPISNPGRNSLDAALDPQSTDYYYYVYYPKAGSHLFARNEEEHIRNKNKVNQG